MDTEVVHGEETRAATDLYCVVSDNEIPDLPRVAEWTGTKADCETIVEWEQQQKTTSEWEIVPRSDIDENTDIEKSGVFVDDPDKTATVAEDHRKHLK